MPELPVKTRQGLEKLIQHDARGAAEHLTQWHNSLTDTCLDTQSGLRRALIRGLVQRLDKRLDIPDHELYSWLLGKATLLLGSDPVISDEEGRVYRVCNRCRKVTRGQRPARLCDRCNRGHEAGEDPVLLTVPCPGTSSGRTRPSDCHGNFEVTARSARAGEEQGWYPYYGHFEARCPACRKADDRDAKSRRARARRARRKAADAKP